MSTTQGIGIHRWLAGTLALVATVSSLGCSTRYIPNTDVPDSDENRKLISFCEEYRRAVERKNIGALLKMASPSYYEDGGNVDASDDIDFAGLSEYLADRFQDATAIRYEIRYRQITQENERILVDYTFSASYRIPGVKGEEWKRKVDDNRLELLQEENGDLRIVAGM